MRDCLGHASISISLDTHSLVMPDMQEEEAEKEEAAEKIDAEPRKARAR
jgi:hypothetical protein